MWTRRHTNKEMGWTVMGRASVLALFGPQLKKKTTQILSSSRMSSVDEKIALRQKEHSRDRVKGRMQCWQ